MKTKRLGQNGPDVSAISLGCMNFTGFYGPSDKQESFACLDAARDHGINFLDTAEVYGTGVSEELIGEYQKDRGYNFIVCLLYTSPSPRDLSTSRMPSSA